MQNEGIGGLYARKKQYTPIRLRTVDNRQVLYQYQYKTFQPSLLFSQVEISCPPAPFVYLSRTIVSLPSAPMRPRQTQSTPFLQHKSRWSLPSTNPLTWMSFPMRICLPHTTGTAAFFLLCHSSPKVRLSVSRRKIPRGPHLSQILATLKYPVSH